MRRGVWVVLGIMGMAPVGALAEQAQRQPIGQGASSSGGAGQAGTASAGATAPPIIVEMPARAAPLLSGAVQRGESWQCRAVTEGSGTSPSRPAQAAPTNQEIFMGRLRAVTGDRLRMAAPDGRVYEFGFTPQTRVIGPNGAAISLQAVREGAPVRTVTREGGGFENQVVTLQILGQPPTPMR
jgi:hypothetical protein